MYNNETKFDSYINCLWNLFQSYNKSIKKNLKYKEKSWLKILEKSKLKLTKQEIINLIDNPDIIFKKTKYNDISLSKIIILKLRYGICIYWLNYLILVVNDKNTNNLLEFNSYLLLNWTQSIDTLISLFESRNEILIMERDKIYSNLQELEKIQIKCPSLDPIHQNRLESQLKALRYILNLEITDELRKLNRDIKNLGDPKYENIVQVLNNIENLKGNITNFLDIFNHLSEELIYFNEDIKIKIFDIPNNKFNQFIGANLKYQKELLEYKNLIFNTPGLTFEILENIKLIELKINMKNTKIINLLIEKSNKLFECILKIIKENSINDNNTNVIESYLNIQKTILDDILLVNNVKESNFKIISNLEKTYKYSDLKDLDLEFYYQFFTHINQLVIGIKKGKTISIDNKKYLSNENFDDKKKFDVLLKTINLQFVNKKEFNNKIIEIEERLSNIENNNSPYIIGTMVISLISLSIWKKIMNFKENFF